MDIIIVFLQKSGFFFFVLFWRLWRASALAIQPEFTSRKVLTQQLDQRSMIILDVDNYEIYIWLKH